MLEMLRNVLDMLHSDPTYKVRMDAVYKQRILENHIRRLSIFEDLSDAEFAKLREAIELTEVPTGGIIFEQFDSSEAFYVIRGGLVKVVANAWTQARASSSRQRSGRGWRRRSGKRSPPISPRRLLRHCRRRLVRQPVGSSWRRPPVKLTKPRCSPD